MVLSAVIKSQIWDVLAFISPVRQIYVDRPTIDVISVSRQKYSSSFRNRDWAGGYIIRLR